MLSNSSQLRESVQCSPAPPPARSDPHCTQGGPALLSNRQLATCGKLVWTGEPGLLLCPLLGGWLAPCTPSTGVGVAVKVKWVPGDTVLRLRAWGRHQVFFLHPQTGCKHWLQSGSPRSRVWAEDCPAPRRQERGPRESRVGRERGHEPWACYHHGHLGSIPGAPAPRNCPAEGPGPEAFSPLSPSPLREVRNQLLPSSCTCQDTPPAAEKAASTPHPYLADWKEPQSTDLQVND